MTDEQRKQCFEKYYAHTGFNAHNGIRLVDVDDGACVVEVTLSPEGLNPLEIAHGGLIFSLCDVATGVAARSGGRSTVSQDASISYLRPGRNTAKLTAKGRVLKEGRYTGVCEAEVFTDDGTLIAKSTVTVFFVDAR